MKVKKRKSSVKYRKQTGFLTRMKTRGGRAILTNKRRRRANKKN